jgi:hypothetical protein
MDDLTFSARRASTAAPARTEPADLETRFRSLVQSPLRAGILRYLSARPEESSTSNPDADLRPAPDGRGGIACELRFGVAFAVTGAPVSLAARPANER